VYRKIDAGSDVSRLLHEVESLIESLPSEGRPTPSGTHDESEIPAFHEIEILETGMDVVANFYPPVGGGAPLRIEAVYESLSEAGVVHGVLHSSIQSAVLELNTERHVQEGLIIARGTSPIDPVPEHWELISSLLERQSQLDAEALSLDPKDHSPFVMVKKGDLLAVQISALSGAGGRDVFGHEIPFKNARSSLYRPGQNVLVDGASCRAVCDGCFRCQNSVFQVDNVLVVRGVDYRTGHIDFDGDVVIQGEIARGFRIQARGSIFSSQVIDASEVVSGADVVTTRGIIGQDGAVVRAEGRVRAKFLENIVLRAVGSIEVRASCLNSVLQTLDKVVMGEKSLLMGGRVLAQNGIEAFQIGTERGAFAELCCGMNYQALEKVVEARDQVMALIKKLKEIDRQKRLHPSMRTILDQAYAKVRDEVTRLNTVSKQWVGQIDRREEAEIVIRGTIFPGNSVEICHQSTVVSRPLSKVRFYLDKKRGVIAWKPL
jgi:uncharacterized protein (DUF342 family)